MTGSTRKLMIKHVVGWTIFDSSKQACTFEVARQEDGGWAVDVHGVAQETINDVRVHLHELNLFYFVTPEDGRIRKAWLYDREEPRLDVDREAGRLRLVLDSKVDYSNDRV